MPQPRASFADPLASRKLGAHHSQRSPRRRVSRLELLEGRALLSPTPLVDPGWMEPPSSGLPPFTSFRLDLDTDPMATDPRADMTTPEEQAWLQNQRNWSEGSASAGDLWLAAVPVEPTDAYA
jgi:hypothetical protein